MISASLSTIVLMVIFCSLFLRHLGSLAQVAVIVRDDVTDLRARRLAAQQSVRDPRSH